MRLLDQVGDNTGSTKSFDVSKPILVKWWYRCEGHNDVRIAIKDADVDLVLIKDDKSAVADRGEFHFTPGGKQKLHIRIDVLGGTTAWLDPQEPAPDNPPGPIHETEWRFIVEEA